MIIEKIKKQGEGHFAIYNLSVYFKPAYLCQLQILVLPNISDFISAPVQCAMMNCRIHSFTHTVVTVTFTPLVSARFILDLKLPI